MEMKSGRCLVVDDRIIECFILCFLINCIIVILLFGRVLNLSLVLVWGRKFFMIWIVFWNFLVYSRYFNYLIKLFKLIIFIFNIFF